MKIKVAIKRHWKDIVFWIISINLTIVSLEFLLPRRITSIMPMIFTVVLPLIFILLYKECETLFSKQTTKLSNSIKISLIICGLIIVISVVGFISIVLNYPWVEFSLDSALEYGKLIKTTYCLCLISIFIFWFIELVNMKKLGDFFIATYFINGGIMGTMSFMMLVMADTDFGDFYGISNYTKWLSVSVVFLGIGVLLTVIMLFKVKIETIHIAKNKPTTFKEKSL